MAWDFNQIVEFGRQFSGPSGTELAFVFSEWAAETGLALSDDYPAVRANLPPTEDAPANQAARVFVKISGGAWQPLQGVPTVTNIGLGTVGELQSGIASSMVIAGWTAKGIAAGYIIAPGATLDQINADRTSGLALIRTYINVDDGEVHQLAPDAPFTAGQVTILSTWLNNHGVTDTEFAALFGVTPAQVSSWLQTHARLEFAQVIHDQFA